MAAKIAYTSALQIVGVIAVAGCLILLARFARHTR